MDISIIICTRDRAHHLEETLSSLRTVQVPDGYQCELLLVDNASKDQTPQVIGAAQIQGIVVRSLHQPRLGKSHALNLALQEARGKVLIFADDDIRFPPSWIEGMSTPIFRGQFQALQGGVRIAPHLLKPWMERAHGWLMGSTDYYDRDNPQGLIGANMAIAREVLEHIPIFDPYLGPGGLGFEEDTLFSYQLRTAGITPGTALDVEVEHHFDVSRTTRAGFLDRSVKGGRSLAYLAHHWHHATYKLPHLRLIKAQLRLAALRLKNRRELQGTEGVPLWESKALEKVHFQKQYLKECKLPRNYEKNGLVFHPFSVAKADSV